MRRISIDTPDEFDFAQCHRFLARSPNECLHNVATDHISKLLLVDNQLIVVQIQAGTKGKLSLSFPNHQPSRSETKFCKNYVIDWLDLDRDLSVFYRVAKKDDILRPLVKRFYGLRLISITDLFEALAWSIIGQQINLAFAYTLKRRLVENFGRQVQFDTQTFFLFPSPAQIAALSPEALRPLQFSQRKAEYLIGIAHQMTEGQLSKIALQALDFDTAKKRLIDIRGIGNWTANYVIMKCLRHPDAFPLEDAGLHNALKQQLQLQQKPSLEQIELLAKNWKGWRAYATFYLWQSLLN